MILYFIAFIILAVAIRSIGKGLADALEYGCDEKEENDYVD